MAKKIIITTVDDLINLDRFKKDTNNKTFSEEEKQEIQSLLTYLNKNDVRMSKELGTIAVICSYEVVNLIERFKFIKENRYKVNEEHYKVRYGDIEGKRRWDEYREKQRYSNTYEAKKKKFNWTREQFDEYNKSRAVTYEKCIKRHGPDKGKKIWEKYVERQRYTNTLEYFVGKYGKDEGYINWKEYNNEKGKSSSLEWIMEKNNVDQEDALEILMSRYKSRYTSKSELTFVNLLEEDLNETLTYTTKTKQFCIWNYHTNSPKFYDITCSKRMKIIEFNGDYWHCNPKKYDKDFFHRHAEMTAKEIWHLDYLKRKAALERGFEMKIVWWSDFDQDPKKVIKECVEWLNQ